MKNTESISKAINMAAMKNGGNAKFARMIGLSPSGIGRYINGYIKVIELESWMKLLPHVKEFLPKEEFQDLKASEFSLVKPSELMGVPILGTAQAAGYEPAIEALDDWVVGHGDGTAYFHGEIRSGWFAIRVDGDSMLPDYPAGTLLLVAPGTTPLNHDIVAARIANDGQVVCKQYIRSNGTITLKSINPGGKDYSWDYQKQPGYALWIWPVMEITLNLRRQREECRKNGITKGN